MAYYGNILEEELKNKEVTGCQARCDLIFGIFLPLKSTSLLESPENASFF